MVEEFTSKAYDGTDIIYYCLNGVKHRVNGPAWVWPAKQSWDWYLHGKWHRYYGPKTSAGAWYIHDEMIIKNANKS